MYPEKPGIADGVLIDQPLILTVFAGVIVIDRDRAGGEIHVGQLEGVVIGRIDAVI